MLARRMLMFALVLLVVTAIAAALAPPQRPVDNTRSDPSPAAPDSDSRVVTHSVSTARPASPTVEVEAGDVLRLTVRSPEAGSVALPGLASARAIAPGSPVTFDVLPTTPDDYPVVMLEDERTVATVRVVSRRER